MKKILLLTGVLLALTVSLASAVVPGLDMGWTTNATNGCPANLTSIPDVSDGCADAFASYSYAMSFAAPTGISKWVGEEFIIDVQSSAPVLPDWWHLEAANAGLGIPAGCRDGSWGFTTQKGLGNTATCKDYWGASPQSGGTVWLPGTGGPARTRLFGAFARATSTAIAITGGVNYYVGSGAMDTNHAPLDPTTTQPCQGCELGACLVFQYIKVAQPAGTPGGDALITAQHNRQYMTWQGGVGTQCPQATPTRKATWGQVKSLYR